MRKSLVFTAFTTLILVLMVACSNEDDSQQDGLTLPASESSTATIPNSSDLSKSKLDLSKQQSSSLTTEDSKKTDLPSNKINDSEFDNRPQGGILKRLWSDPPTLDPHLTSDTTSSGIVVEIFSGLVTMNADLQLIPDLAESWEINEDGTIYIFHLRENAKFHDGSQVTAHDFKWSIERAANPKTASPVAGTYLKDIIGASEVLDGNSVEISGVTVIDDHTLEIKIDAPKAYFLAKLTYPTAYFVNQETVETGGRGWFLDNPNGTGPFKLKEYRIGERLVLERNDLFYRGPANIEFIENNLAGGQSMQMYEKDEIHITGVGVSDLDRILDPNNPLNRDLVVAPPSFSVSYIGFNTNVPPFDDQKFRQALNHSINKELIASQVLSNLVVPAYGILPPGFPGYDEELEGLTFDPQKARKLLSESKYSGFLSNIPSDEPHYELAQELLSASQSSSGDQLPRIIISVPGTGGSVGLDLEVVVDMWERELGVIVDFQQVEWATFLKDLDKQTFQSFAGLGWEADYPDPQDFLDVLFHSDSDINHGAYSNPDADEILEKARTLKDPIERFQLYRQAEKLIVEDAAWVPMWYTGERYVLIKPNVNGYKLTPMIIPKLKEVYFSNN